jgi:cyanophycin synthetase
VEIRKVLALRGPNIWANFPVLEAWVDLGALKDTSSEQMPGFNDRLKSWLPSLIEHRCSVGERGGFFQRLERGTYLAHILEHVTLELQTLAGTNVGYGKARETSEEGVYKVAIRYIEEDLGRAALGVAHRLLMAAVHDTPFDITEEVRKLRDLAHDVCLGPSTNSIVQAAKARGIPFRRLNTGSLVQLGYGCKQHRILAAETDQTSAIAESIAQDKELTRGLLKSAGIPVPRGRPVEDADDAWVAAQEIGTPVVVKPQCGNQGRGVTTNLTTRDQVLTAYAAAREEGSSVIVERFAPGADWRLLIIGGKLVAASRREPAHVIGDGVSTVRQLVDKVNLDPRRSDGHATSLSIIHLDQIAQAVLTSQGHSPDSVPAEGALVLIRRNANLSTGGTAADVTDRVHPDVAARAIEAA